MKDTLSMIVATIFLVILLLLLPLYNYFERQDDISYNVALKAVTTFVDEVTNNGYIDQTSYDNFINRLGQTANSYDVQVEVQKRLLTNDPNGNGYSRQSRACPSVFPHRLLNCPDHSRYRSAWQPDRPLRDRCSETLP